MVEASPEMRRRACILLATAFALAAVVYRTAFVYAAAPAKPLVLIFAGAPPPEVAPDSSGVTATPSSPDGMADPQRNRYAAREVRDRFGETAVADAVLYTPDAPLFVRAILDAKLKMADPANPSQSSRLALAKAIGALYVVTITAEPVPKKPGLIQINLNSVEVASNKTYSDNASSNAGSVVAALPGASSVGEGTGSAKVDNNAWMTASNTLVVRYLAGPLGEYTRALAPPSLLPPSPKPTNDSPPAETAVTPPAPAATPTVATPPANTAAATAPAPAVTPTPAPIATPPPTAAAATVVPTPAPAPVAPAETGPPGPRITAGNIAMQNSTVKDAKQRADALIASGDLNGAIVILRNAVNQAPRSLALRTALAKTYLSAGRTNDAAAEARRALSVAAPNDDREARLEMTHLLADAYTKNGDQTAARAAYQEIIDAQPQAHWARLALGELLLNQQDNDGAEEQFRAVQQADPTNRDAALGLARVRIAKGDFNGALDAVSNIGGDAATRLSVISTLFDNVATKTADAVGSNRTAFDSGQLTREAFYRATTAQSARITSLLSLLRSSAPAEGASPEVSKPYRHRVFAATLLSQAVDGFLAYLEKGDKDAGDQAKVYLVEFRKELAAAQAPNASSSNASRVSAGS